MVRREFRSRILYGIAAPALLLFSVLPVSAAGLEKNTANEGASSGWQARLVGNEASPPRLIAVAKRQQALFLFEHNSPLKLAGTFVCTTGQAVGDKTVEGDLKTPEGVYFVVNRIGEGLDYEKYGNEAYTLNYPNPVDRLRRKTGYGIWVHGRGVPITPNLTEGCIALNNTDLTFLGKDLSAGAPVTLAEAVSYEPEPSPADQATINALFTKTQDWAKAWASRSSTFFNYYDAKAYGIAQGESFAAFRQQKERVFKNVSFIDIKISNLQALPGPGYWVTWFQQDYRASNLSAKGVRRLYWQKDEQGELRIVGMEWAPRLSGTLTAGLNSPIVSDASAVAEGKTRDKPSGPISDSSVAKKKQPAPTSAPRPPSQSPDTKYNGARAFVETWRAAWEKGDLNAYMGFYDGEAVQGARSGTSAIRSHKVGLWKKSAPKKVVLSDIRISSDGDTLVVTMKQVYADSRKFADTGIKTLRLRVRGGSWTILSEDWKPMPRGNARGL